MVLTFVAKISCFIWFGECPNQSKTSCYHTLTFTRLCWTWVCMRLCVCVCIFSLKYMAKAHMFCQNSMNNTVWQCHLTSAMNSFYASECLCVCMFFFTSRLFALAPLSQLNELMFYILYLRPDGWCSCTIIWISYRHNWRLMETNDRI